MIGVFTFPALLPEFLETWGLSNTQAGWLSGVYFAAYAVASPVLVSLTDRVDARRIYVAGAVAAAVSALGFGLLADGFWTALVFRAVGGVALAGTYMPGLRMMVDRIPDDRRARAVPLYTASFSLGTAASFAVAGLLGAWLGWRAAFFAAAVLALGAVLIAVWQRPQAPQRLADPTRLLDFRPVFRNRPAMGYVLGYAAHMWELFALRSWMVAFLTAAAVMTGAGDTAWPSPPMVATLSALVAMASSLIGSEIATRRGRAGMVMVYMALSGLMAAGLGFTIGLPYGVIACLMLIYAGLVQLDSAALTTGAVEMASPGRRGATLAVHSLIGFMAGFVGPLALGMVLDAAGGDGPRAWGMAFASIAVVALLGPLALWWGSRKA